MSRLTRRSFLGLLFVLLCSLIPGSSATALKSPFLRWHPPSAAPGGADPLQDFVDAVNALSPEAFYVAEPEYLTMSGAEVVGMEDVSGNGNDLVPMDTGPGFNATGSANGHGQLDPPGRLIKTGVGDATGLRATTYTVGAMQATHNALFLAPGLLNVFGDSSPPGTTCYVIDSVEGFDFARDDTHANDGSEHCYAIRMRSTGHIYEVDGVVATSDAFAGSGTINDTYANMVLLSDGFLGTDASPLSCHIYFTRELSGADVTALEAAINAYYGITFSALERDDGTRYAAIDAALYRVRFAPAPARVAA